MRLTWASVGQGTEEEQGVRTQPATQTILVTCWQANTPGDRAFVLLDPGETPHSSAPMALLRALVLHSLLQLGSGAVAPFSNLGSK